ELGACRGVEAIGRPAVEGVSGVGEDRGRGLAEIEGKPARRGIEPEEGEAVLDRAEEEFAADEGALRVAAQERLAEHTQAEQRVDGRAAVRGTAEGEDTALTDLAAARPRGGEQGQDVVARPGHAEVGAGLRGEDAVLEVAPERARAQPTGERKRVARLWGDRLLRSVVRAQVPAAAHLRGHAADGKLREPRPVDSVKEAGLVAGPEGLGSSQSGQRVGESGGYRAHPLEEIVHRADAPLGAGDAQRGP